MSKPEREPNGIPTSAAATPATPQKHPPADESVQAMGIDADQLPDEVLLAGLGTGDVRFMAAFVRRFQRLVFGVAKTITGDLATGEDITRRAFEQAFEQARMYGPHRGSVRTWLRTIAREMAVDFIQARGAKPVNRDDLERLLATVSDTPEGCALAREGAAGLRGKLARLPANQARAVTMISIYGMTARQIADAEGIPVSTARMRINDGLQKLGAHQPNPHVAAHRLGMRSRGSAASG